MLISPHQKKVKLSYLHYLQPKQCIMSCQSGKPNLTIVQDSLTGAYLMSKENNNDNTLLMENSNDILMVLTQMTNIKETWLNIF